MTLHTSITECFWASIVSSVRQRQDSKKLGRFLGKWNGETEADCWANWPRNVQQMQKATRVDSFIRLTTDKSGARPHLQVAFPPLACHWLGEFDPLTFCITGHEM